MLYVTLRNGFAFGYMLRQIENELFIMFEKMTKNFQFVLHFPRLLRSSDRYGGFFHIGS